MNVIPDKAAIEQAHERIKVYIHRTPVLTSHGLDEMAGCQLYFKCENFQKVGAFKARGAMNAVLSLSREARSRGVATHSSGNHAQALARAAKIMGIKSYIVMPRTAPEIKKRGVIGYGGEIFECEATLASRESTLAEVIKKTGAVEIHPFNNYDVIAGQATAAKELVEEINDLDFIVAPVGGGGLLSGTALTAKYFSPGTSVVAGEPLLANDAYRSMQSGKIEQASPPATIADGLMTMLGDKTFPIIRQNVLEVITVTDQEIVAAMKLILERLKIVIEPSCAVPFAAVMARHKTSERGKSIFSNKKVGIILSGGNIDLSTLANLFK
jgi:threonine dehydratase